MQKKKAIKVLKPTLREKKRYLVYSLDYFGANACDYEDVKEQIEKSILGFIGELGYGKAGVMFIKGSGEKGILRSSRKYVDHVRTGMMMINKIDKKDVIVRTVGLSGSLNKAEKIYDNEKTWSVN